MNIGTSSIIAFPRNDWHLHNSIFLFVDLQQEYISTGRAFALKDTKNCLTNCQRILKMARSFGVTIVHFRKLMAGTFFNRDTEFSNWIEEFRPSPNEMVFEREQASIYSSPAFTSFVNQIDFPELIVVGLTGEMSCLSTVIESAHRKHKLTFVSDASASRSIENYSEKQTHEIITKIISQYVDVSQTEETISNIGKLQRL